MIPWTAERNITQSTEQGAVGLKETGITEGLKGTPQQG